jgi:hypothetical protein
MLTAVLCVTVVLAGCAGFGGGSDGSSGDGTTATASATDAAGTTAVPTETATPEGEGTTTADPTTAEPTDAATTGGAAATTTGSSAGANASERPTYAFFEFQQPGTYTYEVTMAGSGGQERTGEYVIDVLKAADDQYELQVSLTMGGMSSERTFSGTRAEVQRQMLSSRVGGMLAPLTTMRGFYGGRSLQVGRSWSYSTEQGTASFEVTGTDSYAGVDCFVSEASANGTVVHEACVSPDRGLAPYVAYYDESGELTYEMTLVDYEAG